MTFAMSNSHRTPLTEIWEAEWARMLASCWLCLRRHRIAQLQHSGLGVGWSQLMGFLPVNFILLVNQLLGEIFSLY